MNKIVTTILDLEDELNKLTSASEVEATITVENKGELIDAAMYVNRHLFHPFEKAERDHYHFLYVSEKNPGIRIIVKRATQKKNINRRNLKNQ